MLAAVLALLTAPAQLRAADAASGLAYDEVTKHVALDVSAYRTATFDADFEGARRGVTASEDTSERRYITERRERIDYLGRRRATIVDCDTRTITLLDLSAKTYRIIPFEPEAPSDAATPAKDSVADEGAGVFQGAKFLATTTTATLGARVFGSLTTEVYSMEMESTIEFPNAPVSTNRLLNTFYYLSTAVPKLICRNESVRMQALTAAYGISTTYGDIRSSAMAFVNSSGAQIKRVGPEIPSGRLALLLATTMNFQRSGMEVKTASYIEVGHVRQIAADDPVFEVPAGFTKSK
jgi:hypothetical protein